MNMRKICVNMKLKATVFLLPFFLGIANILFANTYVVSTTKAEGKGSLNEALQRANAHIGTDKITFALTQKEAAYVIQTGRRPFVVSDELIIEGSKDLQIALNTEGPLFANAHLTIRDLSVVKNFPLTIPKGVDFVFENCFFLNKLTSDVKYTRVTPLNEDGRFKNCYVEMDNSFAKLLSNNAFNTYAQTFENLNVMSAYDAKKVIQNTVNQLIKNINFSKYDGLKLYKDTLFDNENKQRILYRFAQTRLDTVPAPPDPNCGGSSNVLSLIISENSVIVGQPSDVTQCLGGNLPLTITIIGGTGTITYQWQTSDNGVAWTNIAGAIGTTYTPPSTEVSTKYYRVIISSDVTGCGAVVSTASTVVVLADPSVSLVAEKSALCAGETAIINATVSGGSGAVTYQWQSSLNGSTWTDVAGATGTSLAVANISATTSFRVIVKQVSGCETISEPTNIIVGACNGVIGDFVWLDCNRNGVQDAGEVGLKGVTVTLSGTAFDNSAVSTNATTSAGGQYQFTGVKPGKYTLTFSSPAGVSGLTFSPKNAGGNALDSDADGSGKTTEFNFASNQVITDLDAGMFDATVPVISNMTDKTVVSCDGKGNTEQLQQWLAANANGVATDNISKTLVWKNNFTSIIKTCSESGSVNVTFTVTDECGNSATASATFVIEDKTPPVFSNVPADVKLKCGDVPTPAATPSVFDECDKAVVTTMVETNEVLCGKGFKVVRIWMATDACGNSSTAKQTLILEDTEKPRILNVPSGIALTCQDVIPTGVGVIAVDNCDDNPRVTMSDLVTRGGCGANYTINRIWTAADACGNTGTATQVITVGDFDLPVISGVPADVTVSCVGSIPPASKGVTAKDGCSTGVTLSVADKKTQGACSNKIVVTRTWSAKDACGNISIKSQIITVNDTTPPTLVGVPSDITVNLYLGQKVPTAPRVTATDNCDSRPAVKYTESKMTNLCGYTLKRTWSVFDNCQNAVSKSQIITVLPAENLAKAAVVIDEDCNNLNGRIEMSPNTAAYTYKWDDGTIAGIRSNLPSGVYKVTATATTSGGTCVRVIDVAVKRVCDCERPVVTVDKQDASCTNPLVGFATINTSNILATDLKYTWTPAVSTTDRSTNLAQGTYKVRVERLNSPTCFTEVNFTIEAPKFVTVNDPSVSAAFCGGAKGSITYNVPANDPLVFKWADGATGNTRTNLDGGDYQVTVTRSNSTDCPLVKTVTVPSDNPMKSPYVINRQPACGLPNGSVTINTTGGSGTYTYSWGEGNSRFVLPAGPVNVTVTDVVSGCTNVVSFVLTNNSPAVSVSMDSVVSVTCNGLSDGRVNYRLNFGAGFTLPAKVEVRNLSNTLFSNGALAAGNYVLMVKDSAGCLSAEKSFTVVTPPAIVITTLKNNQTCDSLGNITLKVSGGNGGFKYNWADVTNVANQTAFRENLLAGFYNVTITDATGCAKNIKNIQVKDSCACRPAVVDSFGIVKANCVGNLANGAATIYLKGGLESNYTYAWSPSVGTANTIGNGRTGLPSGTYTVVITSKTNAACITTVQVGVGSLEGPANVLVATTPASCDAANGAATLTCDATPHTYLWLFDGKTAATRNDLKVGVYQVKVSQDANPSCYNVVSVRIESDNKLSGFATITKQPACGALDGAAKINVQNGSGSYKFSWGTTDTRLDLSAGSYAVTVTDNASNCKAVATFTLSNQVSAPVAIAISNPIINLNCAGAKDGRVIYTLTGAMATSQISLVDGNNRVYENGLLGVGSYCIVVKDGQGCIVGSQCFEVKEPKPIVAKATITNKTCALPGGITVNVTGGMTGTYTFAWSDLGTVGTTFTRNTLEAGTYAVTVYDRNGCSFILDNITIANECATQNTCSTFTASSSVVDKNCTEAGKITITANNGTKPLSFDWADLAGTSNPQNRLDIVNGTYSVTVSDAMGCTAVLSNITVKDNCPNIATCTPPVIGGITVTDASCNQNNGQITISVLRPTTVIYKWGPSVSTDNLAKNLASGVYKVKISTNDTTCFIEKDIVVKNQDGIQIGQPSISAATCGTSNGRVEFPAYGVPLNFAWSDGKSGSVRNNLSKGAYFVTITDPSNTLCRQITSIDVPAANSLIAVAVIDKKAVCGQANGQATIRVVGGSASYTYSWGNAATRTDLKAGTYLVTVTDNVSGCTASVSFTMSETVTAGALVNITNPVIYLSCAGEANGSVVYGINYTTGFAAPARIVLSDNLGRKATNDNLAAGRYTLFVYDNNNCLAGLGSFEVREPQPIVISSSATAQTCTAKGTIGLTVSGGSGLYTYSWSDLTGSNQPKDRTSLVAGAYTVTVTDSKGCNRVLSFNVASQLVGCPASCTLAATVATTPKTCANGGVITMSVQNGSGVYFYKWSDLGTTNNKLAKRTDLAAGTFSVTITDSVSNCAVIVSNIVVQNNAIGCTTACNIIAQADVSNRSCTVGGSIRLVNIINGLAPYKFDWLDVAGTDNPQNRTDLAAGKYTVVITDSLGCKDTLLNIAVLDDCRTNCTPPTISNLSVVDATCGASNGAINLTMSDATSYVYTWTPNVSTTGSATNLLAGLYKIRIARLNDPTCFIDKDLVVNNLNNNLVLTPAGITNATCGASNGSATIGGQAAWTYRWSDGTTGQTHNFMSAGTYYVSVTDPAATVSCPVVQTIVINAISSLAATVVVNKQPTCNTANGQATITVTGGSGSYAYSWGASNVRTDLRSGTTNVTITDNQTGCSASVTMSLLDAVTPSATVTITTPIVALKCKGDKNGTVAFTTVYPVGYPNPANSKILDGFGNVMTNGFLVAGKYSIVAYDGNGCVAGMAKFEVTEPAAIMVKNIVTPADCATKGNIAVTVSGGAPQYFYDWADLTGTNDPKDRINLNEGVYNLTITDANTCKNVVSNIVVGTVCTTVKPKRDTVARTVLVGRPDNYCPPTDPALSGQVLTYSFCNGSTTSTFAYGSASITNTGCVNYASGTSTGKDAICMTSCNNKGICDTTIIIYTLIQDPSLCSPSYTGSTTLGLTNCAEFALACTQIPYRQSANYIVTDNGASAQFSQVGCKQDTVYTYSYFTLTRFYPTGPWDLDSWVVNGQVYKGRIPTMTALADSMNRWDPRGNWTVDAATQVIIGGDNSRTYGSMVWKRANRTVATFQPNRQFAPASLIVKLAAGQHTIVFIDKIRGCKDTAKIDVVCNTQPIVPKSYKIDTVVFVGRKDTFCLSNLVWASQTTIRNVCVGSYKGYAGYTVDDNTDCIRTTGVSLGRDTMCFRRCYTSGVCDTITMTIAVKPFTSASDTSCIKAYTGATLLTAPCGSKAQLCTQLQGTDTLNYVITDNGLPYKNGFASCGADTLYSFNYFSLVLNNPTGPWLLSSWTINSKTYTALIPNIRAFVDSLNKWDAGGNWVLEPTTYSIKGGKKGNTYGLMQWSRSGLNVATLSPNRQIIVTQIGMGLDVGTHTVIFRNQIKRCNDTVVFTVNCSLLRTRPSKLMVDTIIYINESGKLFLPKNGTAANLTNIVPICNAKGNISYVVDDATDCIILNGVNLGRDTICLKRCATDGSCDTVKVAVNVVKRTALNTETVYHYVTVGIDSSYCVNTSELKGTKFTIRNVCENNVSNSVNFIPTSNTCMSYMTDAIGVDTACIVVCDETGLCDTTRLIVFVAKESAYKKPKAVADFSITNKSSEVAIRPITNDSLYGMPGSIVLVTQPTNGTVTFDESTGKTIYKPTAENCVGRDSFKYAVITAGGRDTTWISIEVLCDEVIVFSGFSPNGDGVNDVFSIIGLEKYPNNKLLVFNRVGNQVFEAANYQGDWDGVSDGKPLTDGTYFYVIDLGNGKKLSGYVQVHR
jgi:gliding motility-associated-like protein